MFISVYYSADAFIQSDVAGIQTLMSWRQPVGLRPVTAESESPVARWLVAKRPLRDGGPCRGVLSVSGRTGARDGLHRDRSPIDAVEIRPSARPVSLFLIRLSSYPDPSRGAPGRGPVLLSDPAPGVLGQGAARCQRPAATPRHGGGGRRLALGFAAGRREASSDVGDVQRENRWRQMSTSPMTLGSLTRGGGGQSTQPQHLAQRSTEMRDDLVRREDTRSYLHL